MFTGDVTQLLSDPLYLSYEAAIFALVAAPLWHLMDKIIDSVWDTIRRRMSKTP